MRLRVGINENVTLKGASINEKGSLSLSFGTKGGMVSTEDDFLNRAAEIKDNNDSSMIIFVPSVEYNGETREVKQIANSLAGFRDQLQHFLLGYTTSDKALLKPYDGIDTSDSEAFVASLGTQATVNKIYSNLATQFIAKLAEIGSVRLNSELFRLLLIRRSAANHYGTLRSNFINDNPFWEPMTIPAANSQLRFTKYEIGKRLNNGEPVTQAAADSTDAPASGEDAASQILGSR